MIRELREDRSLRRIWKQLSMRTVLVLEMRSQMRRALIWAVRV